MVVWAPSWLNRNEPRQLFSTCALTRGGEPPRTACEAPAVAPAADLIVRRPVGPRVGELGPAVPVVAGQPLVADDQEGAEAADLVRAHTRGRPLVPVVRLRTVRTIRDLLAGDTLVAEIADDLQHDALRRGLGHTQATFAEANFRAHLLGGIRYAASRSQADCRPETGYTTLYNGATTGWSQTGPGSFTNSNGPTVTSVTQTNRSWTDSNRNYAPDCDLTNFAKNGECGAISGAATATIVRAGSQTARSWA